MRRCALPCCCLAQPHGSHAQASYIPTSGSHQAVAGQISSEEPMLRHVKETQRMHAWS
jgi:hypothetical protein